MIIIIITWFEAPVAIKEDPRDVDKLFVFGVAAGTPCFNSNCFFSWSSSKIFLLASSTMIQYI